MPVVPENELSPFAIITADKLAQQVNILVQAGILDSRSSAADALLAYATTRFGSHDPIGELENRVKKYESKSPRSD